ncbi:MAG TPA: HD domain-containing protein [Candidatus Limnocylindrales bacterium]|nr:HD domain-containing protein [Candidatus Limnocylindrales bacterium]
MTREPDDLQRIFEFIIELDKLKAIVRRTKPTVLERYENSAEHSWQVCLLAVLLAQHSRQPVDVTRVVEILLVHDIPEIDAGDRIVYEAPSDARTATERQAASRIFGILPEPQANWCMSRWEEYEARESSEAVFAYAMDRLMPVLHNLESHGQSWRENNVSLEKVLSVNAVIGEVLPAVWERVQVLIAKNGAGDRT